MIILVPTRIIPITIVVVCGIALGILLSLEQLLMPKPALPYPPPSPPAQVMPRG